MIAAAQSPAQPTPLVAHGLPLGALLGDGVARGQPTLTMNG
jgi:hypothetical protein